MSDESYQAIDLRIKKVRGFSLSSPYGSGKVLGQSAGLKSIGFIEVTTESGLTGIGETYAGVYAPELVQPVAEFLAEFVIGRTVGDDNIISSLAEIPFIGRNGLLRSVASAIDIALWDLRGKVLGLPIHKLLGLQHHEEVGVYASSGSAALSPKEIEEDVKTILSQGHTAYKMRVGYQDWATDLRRVDAARRNLGAADLMVDAIMGTLRPSWDAATAISRASDLEQYGLRWLEEPVAPDDIAGLAEVRQRCRIPIAAGEAYSGSSEYRTLLDASAVDVLQFDATHSGGISACLSLGAEAKIRKLDSAVHVWGSAAAISANASLALACQAVSVLEIPMVYLEITEKMWIEPPSIISGVYRPSQSPGLGVELPDSLKNDYKLVPSSGYRLPKVGG
tara:strand:- start:5304 stop:6482 length:1179 start_codon:yes stop_codon:yes gene_type:complete